jgi:6-pyruvoyl-tetrahydropterin synthase
VIRWVIHSEASFAASHALTSYQGAVETSHEHAWKVAVQVGTHKLNEDSFALDFHQVRDVLAAAVDPLEGSNLNLHSEIGTPSPTAERVAEVLARRLGPQFEAIGGQLLVVSVWEGPENRVDLNLS